MKTHDGTVRRWIAWIAPLTLLAFAAVAAAEDPRWVQARTLEAQQRWVEAGEAYAAILAADPTSQEAAVKRAVCQLEAGLAAQAADALETAVDMAPNSYWAGVGLYYQADACHRADCHKVARDAIARLKAGFPGLLWTTRAEIIEARLNGLGEAPFETAFARETEADGLYREALRLAKDRDDPGALEVLDEVRVRYADTRTALAALHSEANVLSRDKIRTEAAMKAFQEVLADLRENAPQSMMRFEAQKSVAALYQRLDMPEEAMSLYDDVGRVTSEAQHFVVTNDSYTVQYAYAITTGGRSRTLTYPGGRTVTESYDGRNRLYEVDSGEDQELPRRRTTRP